MRSSSDIARTRFISAWNEASAQALRRGRWNLDLASAMGYHPIETCGSKPKSDSCLAEQAESTADEAAGVWGAAFF